MVRHTLPAFPDFGRKSKDVVLAYYDGVSFSVGGGVFNFGMDNFLKLIRGWFIRDDMLAMWQSEPREILIPSTKEQNLDDQYLEDLERKVLDSSKYFGSNEWLTCLTYNKGDNGTVTLFKVEMSSTSEEKPRTVRPVAVMNRVPKVILKDIQSAVHSSKKVILRFRKDKLKWTIPQSMKEPRYRISHGGSGQGDALGGALQKALVGIKKSKECSSMSTTIPQMLAWLHLGSSFLEEVDSGKVRSERRSGRHGSSIQRTVKWNKGPDQKWHGNANPQIVVLIPNQDGWASERIHWR
jgi:hypothetical protein